MDPEQLPPRLRSKIAIDDASGCWNFTGSTTANGYGRVFDGSRTDWAHRVYYRASGRMTPKGLYLDHLCRNRRCVNPSHLDLVTNQVNVVRGLGPQATRDRHRRQTLCKRGHPLEGENIRLSPSGSRICRACSLEHGRASRARHRSPDRRSRAVVTPLGVFVSASAAARKHGIPVSTASWRARNRHDGWAYANTPLRCEAV